MLGRDSELGLFGTDKEKLLDLVHQLIDAKITFEFSFSESFKWNKLTKKFNKVPDRYYGIVIDNLWQRLNAKSKKERIAEHKAAVIKWCSHPFVESYR